MTKGFGDLVVGRGKDATVDVEENDTFCDGKATDTISDGKRKDIQQSPPIATTFIVPFAFISLLFYPCYSRLLL